MTGAGRAVQCVDGGMFVGGELESEQIEVFLLTLGVHGLRDDDGAVLDVPAQNHLGRGYAVRGGDAFDGTIASVEVGAARHGEYASMAMPCSLQ